MNQVDGLWRRLSLHLLPPRCLLCRAPGHDGRELCSDCARELPWNRRACARCAMPLAAPTSVCGDCQQQAPTFDRLFAPLQYAYPLDGLVQRFKFRHDLAAGALLADLLGDAMAASHAGTSSTPALIVPVPLHRRRLRERGYNQSLEIAKRIAARLGLALDAHALERVLATDVQSGLDAAARRRNVRDAFVADAARVRDRPIALVDDVATTAATANECARALKQAGASAVSVWVVARAPGRHD